MSRSWKTRYVRVGGKLFTPEEVAIADLAMQGFGNSEIAEKLHLAKTTVQKRFNTAENECFYHRTGSRNRSAFTAWWKEARMVQDDRDLTFYRNLIMYGSELVTQANYQSARDQFDMILDLIQQDYEPTSSVLKKEELRLIEAEVLLERIRIFEDLYQPDQAISLVKADHNRIKDIGDEVKSEDITGCSYVRLGEGFYVILDFESALKQLETAATYWIPNRYKLLCLRHKLLSTVYLEGMKSKKLFREVWKKAHPYLLEGLEQGDDMVVSFLEGYGRGLCICKDDQGMDILFNFWREAATRIGILPTDLLRYMQYYRSIVEGVCTLRNVDPGIEQEAYSKGSDLARKQNIFRYKKIFTDIRRTIE
jgi:tetratricopeptide (TPR) repeat protein